jgi:Xaa-Pro aminopeptidase
MPEGLLLVAESKANGDMYAATRFLTADPVLWLETGERRILVVTGFDVELARRSSPATEVWALEEVVAEERAAGGRERDLRLARALNAVRRAGVDAVRVPYWFPLDEADHLRANGIGVRTDDEETVATRRRMKSAADVELLQAVQRETEIAMELVRATLRRCDIAGDRALMLDGSALTSERLRSIIQLHWVGRGLEPVTPIAAGGPQGADPHEHGSGPLRAGEPIVFDLFPRDEQTRVYGDMSRTFCVGAPSDEVAEAHGACDAAIRAAIAAARPGITGRELHIIVSDLFRDRGYPSQIHPAASLPGASEWVFSHGLGHGVGFNVHEPPNAGTQGFGELAEGDSLTIEPGLYRPGVGGCRIEDHVILTADGCRNLNTMDYALVV